MGVDYGISWASLMAQELRIYLQCRRHRRCLFDPWVRKIPWGKKWQPTPVFLPGKFQEQRSLAVYSPACRVTKSTTRLSTHMRWWWHQWGWGGGAGQGWVYCMSLYCPALRILSLNYAFPLFAGKGGPSGGWDGVHGPPPHGGLPDKRSLVAGAEGEAGSRDGGHPHRRVRAVLDPLLPGRAHRPPLCLQPAPHLEKRVPVAWLLQLFLQSPDLHSF